MEPMRDNDGYEGQPDVEYDYIEPISRNEDDFVEPNREDNYKDPNRNSAYYLESTKNHNDFKTVRVASQQTRNEEKNSSNGSISEVNNS